MVCLLVYLFVSRSKDFVKIVTKQKDFDVNDCAKYFFRNIFLMKNNCGKKKIMMKQNQILDKMFLEKENSVWKNVMKHYVIKKMC